MIRLAALAALALPTVAAAQPAATVEQTNMRYDEDWSGVTATAPRRDADWWKAAKHRPLDKDGDVYLTTGLELRIRQEGFDDNNWGDPPAADDGYLWIRMMPHADLHAGPVRAFVQGIAGYARGVGAGKGPADETGIDLLQGFADVRLPLAENAALTLRGGRELVALGSERLVGLRYGPNIPQAFDGGRAILNVGPVRLDAFAMRPVAVGLGDFDDRRSRTRRLSGVYASATVARDIGLDLYWLGYRNETASFAQGAGDERRDSYGVRLFGKRGGLAWNWEAALQRGSFGAARIRAWTVATETAYRFADAPLTPRIRLRANIASGDRDPGDRTLGTFNALFPKGKYFGELSPIGPYNIANLHPSLDVDLGRGFTLDLAGIAYWRASRGDGVYNVPGQLIRAPGDARSRFIGTQAEALLGWQASEILSFGVSLSLFRPGDFIRETGPARTIHMIGSEAMLRF